MSTNYSKWDKFVQDISDDSDNETQNEERAGVQVLQSPGSVTIGPEGVQIKDPGANKPTVENNPIVQPATKPCDDTLNGGECNNYTWSQTKDEVVLRFDVNNSTRAKDIKFNVTTRDAEKILKIELDGVIIVNKTLSYDVSLDEDGNLDWEIKSRSYERNGSTKCLEIRLPKVSPIQGAVFWWKNVFRGDTEIDTSRIQGRKDLRAHAAVWEEAHRMFREKIAQKTKIDVDLEEDIDEDSLP